MVKGISYARYLSLILQFVYQKEGIAVPEDEVKEEFVKYHFPKTVEDDVDIFPIVARIPDGMLKKVDPTNLILVEYLKHINPLVENGVLLKTSEGGSSKKTKNVTNEAAYVVTETPKKTVKSSKKVVSKVTKPETKHVAESSKEVISSKYGLLKRLRNLSHNHRSSFDDHSPIVRKAQLNRKEVLV